MFINFFHMLRLHGLDVSVDEWLTLMEALDQGMAENSLMEFYYLCRNILIKSETEYDKFDQAFAAFFQGIESVDDIPEELWNWLSEGERERLLEDMPDWAKAYDLDTLRQMFRERLAEQARIAAEMAGRLGRVRELRRALKENLSKIDRVFAEGMDNGGTDNGD